MKFWKIVFLAVFGGIAVSSIVIGIVEQAEQKKRMYIHRPFGVYERIFKRPLDFALALSALIILGPVIILASGMVRWKAGSPVFFNQKRPGRDGEIFVLHKLRTMSNEKDEDGNLLPDDKRVTKLGLFLRSTSIDELPQLINIIKGDMSIIGPRPLLEEYLPYYTDEESHRHDIRPGLSGLAQIHGRNNITWEEMFSWDIKYVNKVTLLGDIKILLKTVISVLKRENVVVFTAETDSKLNVLRGEK